MLGKLVSRLTYANVMATAAVFIAIGGGAYAAGLAKNSVGSKQIRDGQVKGVDVKDDSLTGKDVNESQLNLPEGPPGEQGPPGQDGKDGQPIGAAGGSLSGSYPNPTIAGDAIASAQVLNNSLTGADIDESNLATVPTALVAEAFSGSLSGDVSGAQGSTSITANAVGSPEVAPDSLKGADIDESSLSGVDAQTLSGMAANGFAPASAVRASGLVQLARPGTGVSTTTLLNSGPFRFDGLCERLPGSDQNAVRIKVVSTEAGAHYILDEDSGVLNVRQWSGDVILQQIVSSPITNDSLRGLMQSFTVTAPSGKTFQGEAFLAENLSGGTGCSFAISGMAGG